jgi:hypothetical protein
MNELRQASCCPSFILAVAGPWISVLGAVYLESIVIQPLTDFLWIGARHSQVDGVQDVARIFWALARGLHDLESFYTSLLPTRQTSRFFPWLDFFLGENGREVRFRYTKALGGEHFAQKSIFQAETIEESPHKIVVKFTRRYNGYAHNLLYAQGYAPKLYFDGSEYPEVPRPDGLCMIVMDFVPQAPPGPVHQEAYSTLRTALKILHDHGLVFGDLRRPNILVPRSHSGTEPKIMLVDFDWCGEDGKHHYPWDINTEGIKWANGVGPGQVMRKSHDLFMLDPLLL